MPADGISLPPKKGYFGTSRWGGSKVRLHQPRDWAEGGMNACGTERRSLPRTQFARKRSEADIRPQATSVWLLQLRCREIQRGLPR
jgi:hypothetical protein